MGYISVKKLSEKYKIDFYQFISYLEFLNIPIEIENKIKTISNENIALIDKFISTYTTNQINCHECIWRRKLDCRYVIKFLEACSCRRCCFRVCIFTYDSNS